MIKIQTRIGLTPHTIAIYLVYSMQTSGLNESEGQGLFTFPPGLRQQAAQTFMLNSGAEIWMAVCFTSNL